MCVDIVMGIYDFKIGQFCNEGEFFAVEHIFSYFVFLYTFYKQYFS